VNIDLSSLSCSVLLPNQKACAMPKGIEPRAPQLSICISSRRFAGSSSDHCSWLSKKSLRFTIGITLSTCWDDIRSRYDTGHEIIGTVKKYKCQSPKLTDACDLSHCVQGTIHSICRSPDCAFQSLLRRKKTLEKDISTAGMHHPNRA